ncbi:hypothetical protein V6N13_035698 [Hibiscus sabdariffa]
MVSACGLHDLDFVGPHFTWYRGRCSVRLDRCLGNSQWFTRFPRSILHHLTRMKSDHRPICLATDDHVSRTRVHSFHYFAGWSLHRDFHSFVSNNWNPSLPLAETIKGFTAAVSTWNSELIRVIVTLLHRAWVVDISWIPRGENDPVDWLAKKALRSSCQSLILNFPLPDLLPLLSADMNGASLEQDHRVNLIVVNSEG